MGETKVVAAPSPAQVDTLIERYAELKATADEASAFARTKQDAADVVKDELVSLVEQFGLRHTEKSRRLRGNRHTATTTVATRVSVDDRAVDHLREYLDAQEMTEISKRIFVAHTTYSLVEGPQEVLKGLSLAKRLRDRIAALLGVCFVIKTNRPSLKIETAA